MYNLIRFYNQNRKQILIIILFIVFVIGIIQFLNYLAKNKTYKVIDNKNESSLNVTNSVKESLVSEKSIIENTKVNSKKLENNLTTIDNFINYCNNKDINSAYNLLTGECKELMYPTIEDFYKSYYVIVFNGENKTYTIENWTGKTYQVLITDDILSTGKLETSKTKRDFITVVSNNDGNKININSYIGRDDLNKVTTDNDIEINVLYRDVFMDYEMYSFKVKNNSKNTIFLDDCKEPKSLYLVDNNDLKYYYYNTEITVNNLEINSKYEKNFRVKFGKKYSTSKRIKEIVFSNAIVNYDEYIKNKNDENIKKVVELKAKI